jgi:hypothetical protein
MLLIVAKYPRQQKERPKYATDNKKPPENVSSSDCGTFLLHFWGENAGLKLLETAHCARMLI